MLVHVLKFSENEYVADYDLSNKEVSVINDKWNAERFYVLHVANLIAEELGCEAESIELEHVLNVEYGRG